MLRMLFVFLCQFVSQPYSPQDVDEVTGGIARDVGVSHVRSPGTPNSNAAFCAALQFIAEEVVVVVVIVVRRS